MRERRESQSREDSKMKDRMTDSVLTLNLESISGWTGAVDLMLLELVLFEVVTSARHLQERRDLHAITRLCSTRPFMDSNLHTYFIFQLQTDVGFYLVLWENWIVSQKGRQTFTTKNDARRKILDEFRLYSRILAACVCGEFQPVNSACVIRYFSEFWRRILYLWSKGSTGEWGAIHLI